MRRIILSFMLLTSLSFSGSLFKEDNDEKTHIMIGTMSGLISNLLAKKFGANETEAFLIGVAASMAAGVIVGGGNIDLASDAIGGAIGSSTGIILYKW